MDEKALLDVRELQKYFPITRGFLRRKVGEVKAVDGVSFSLTEGETLSLVGESGCGKSTTGRLILRAHKPTGGKILYRRNDDLVDLARVSEETMRDIRREIQMIFQDPFSSLNPRMTVQDVIAEGLVCHGWKNQAQIRERVDELMVQCGLDPRYKSRYPHAFSGGQRQRIGVARALALGPKLIVADEPVSALDVSVQAQVLNLLMALQDDLNLTYLFISHDLSVVEHISDRVAVMYIGKLVELAETSALFTRPRHPYTEMLLSSTPRIQISGKRRKKVVSGEVGDPANRPSGCAFHTRCPYAEEICKTDEPPLINIGKEGAPPHFAACHFAEELKLTGTVPAQGNVA